MNPDHLKQIAIISMVGRFPGAGNVDQYWQNLCQGVESITFFTDSELEESGIDRTLLADPTYIKAAGIISGVEYFDAAFFGYNPREAEVLDPQQRIFLELSWEALEIAGYNPATYKGAVGVFAGANWNTYKIKNVLADPEFLESVSDYQVLLGNDKDFITTRVSYKLDLKGPSVNIQTACSSSLVAVHHACRSLQAGECSMALAGGFSVRVPQKTGYFYREGSIWSADGHCRAFDAGANGTVFSSGGGVVVLKRLADALADGDHIHAVIRGSAVNNDGAAKVGFTAPSINGQREVVEKALENAGLEPDDLTYIETHGTGTPVGDPIEINALTQAFRKKTQRTQFCAIGSVKTNVGHFGAASGIAGLIKTIFILKHKLIPPSLHYQKPNPNINFAHSPFYVNTQLNKWQTEDNRYYAGVSSFGIGGTNVHIILGPPPPGRAPGKSRPWQLLTLSARTDTALENTLNRLYEYFQTHPDINWADAVYTLNQGRKSFPKRRVLLAQDRAAATRILETMDPVFTMSNSEAKGAAVKKKIIFMFPGQGAQHVNMAREVYESEPIFREQVDLCAEILKPLLNEDIRDIIYPGATEQSRQENQGDPEPGEAAAAKLTMTALAQPAIFTIEYAYARLLIHWGIAPRALIGHSIGEYTAACLAGVFSLEDALYLVCKRGQLMQTLPPGQMLSVPLAEKDIGPYLDEDLSAAAVNSPNHCIISGTNDAVDRVREKLTRAGIDSVLLHTSHAFHSPMMEPILELFAAEVAKVTINPPKLKILSTVSGNYISTDEPVPGEYWLQNLRETVRFSAGIQKLAEANTIFLEVGPGRTLSTLVKAHGALPHDPAVMAVSGHVKDKMPGLYFLLQALGQLWLAGCPVDWQTFYSHEKRSRVPLPGYSFERQRFWITPQKQLPGAALPAASAAAAAVKKANIAEWFYLPSWKRTPLPELLNNNNKKRGQAKMCCVIFGDTRGIGPIMAQSLAKQGHDVISVNRGDTFSGNGTSFTIDPKRSEDYDTLFRTLRETGKKPDQVIHLWLLTDPGADPEEGLPSETIQYNGFYSLLFITQALGKNFSDISTHIGVTGNNIVAWDDRETLCPAKATVIGPCKVIPQEYAHITCNLIDIVVPPPGSDEENSLVQTLLDEYALRSSDPVIAYRDNRRWVQTYEPVLWSDKKQSPGLLRQQGVYVIIGGLGGIGLVLAGYLAGRVPAKIVLTGRSPFPPREQWAQRLNTHGPQDAVNKKILKIQELEKTGAQVLILQADVLDLGDMQEIFKQTHKHFGPVNGIIYAAGLPGGGMIQLKTASSAAEVLAPKVKGLAILANLTADEKIDFLVLCSSLASIWGGVGRVDYSAANAFLDAFAHYYTNTRRILTISINWDMWQEVGMGVDVSVPANLARQRRETLKNGILSAEGTEVFERILWAGVPQVIVSTRDLQQRIIERRDELLNPSGTGGTGTGTEAGTEAPTRQQANPRPVLPNTYAAPRNEFETTIAAIWQKIFGIDKVGIHDDFFQLGGHSLLATQLLNRLQKDYSFAELSLRDLFDNPTIASTAELIDKAHKRRAGKKAAAVKDNFRSQFPLDRPVFMQNYLKEKLARAFNITPDRFPANGDLRTFDLESVTTNLIWDIKRDFQLPLYPHEILKRPVLEDLARFIVAEYAYWDGTRSRELEISPAGSQIEQIFRDEYTKTIGQSYTLPAGEKNKSMVFILSAPRAGSTLLRLMMAGHPGLFCPPELGLLMYRSIAHWSQNRLLPFSREGIVIALMELLNIDAAACKNLVDNMKQQNKPIRDVYKVLQDAVGNRIMVDKTPRYSMFVETLDHAEAIFTNARYIHLIRHPYPVIQSFARNRFEKLFTETDVDPYCLAERIWTTYNRNILEFSKKIPPERYHLLPYEDLVRDPRETMRKLCDFIGIPFDEALTAPYDGKKRMIDGPGDPNIFQHDKIEANLGDAWKNISLPRPLETETRDLAGHLGYDLTQEIAAGVSAAGDGAVPVPISYAQRKYWDFDCSEPGNPAYNLVNAYLIKGPFAVPIITRTLAEITRRHETLRTVFREINGQPGQLVLKQIKTHVPEIDLRHFPADEKEKELQRIIRGAALYRFNLQEGPLLFLTVIRLAEEEYVLVRYMSHICSDGWSLSVLRKEMGALYGAFAAGQPVPLPEPALPYSAYVYWLRDWLRSETAHTHLDYWQQKLVGPLPILNLPTDYPRPVVPTYEAGRHDMAVPPALYEAMIALSSREKCTLFITLLAAFNVLLYAYSGQEDIIVGTPVSGRRRSELETLIGCFADFIAVRVNLRGEPTFLELLNRVKNECMEAFQHQDLPFEKVREELLSSGSSEPIYRVILNMLNYEDMQPDFPGLEVSRIEVDKQRVETDLKILLMKNPTGLNMVLYYNTGLFREATMSGFLENYLNILSAITVDPGQKITAITLDKALNKNFREVKEPLL